MELVKNSVKHPDQILPFIIRKIKLPYINMVETCHHIKLISEWSKRSVAKNNKKYTIPTEMINSSIDATELRRQTIGEQKAWIGHPTPAVSDGTWDRYTYEISSDPRYTAIKKYHENSSFNSLEDTEYEDFLNSEYQHKISSVEGQLTYFENLYQSMADNGYDEQFPVCLLIDRSGNYIIRDGRHRVAIAKVLKIGEIPSIVTLRHRDWQEVREKFAQAERANVDLDRDLKRYHGHPDLAEFEVNV